MPGQPALSAISSRPGAGRPDRSCSAPRWRCAATCSGPASRLLGRPRNAAVADRPGQAAQALDLGPAGQPPEVRQRPHLLNEGPTRAPSRCSHVQQNDCIAAGTSRRTGAPDSALRLNSSHPPDTCSNTSRGAGFTPASSTTFQTDRIGSRRHRSVSVSPPPAPYAFRERRAARSAGGQVRDRSRPLHIGGWCP